MNIDKNLMLSNVEGVKEELLNVSNTIYKYIIYDFENRWKSKESFIFLDKLNEVCGDIKNITYMLDDLKIIYNTEDIADNTNN